VLIVSRPEIYTHEWTSFSTKDFPENQTVAKSGDKVRIIVTDQADPRPVEDILWTDSVLPRSLRSSPPAVIREVRALGPGRRDLQFGVSESNHRSVGDLRVGHVG
jgi:hypothetical protein